MVMIKTATGENPLPMALDLLYMSQKVKWERTRRKFLKGKQTHEGYYVCQKCGKWIANPHVHHIVFRSQDPTRVHDLTNLMILCFPCHAEIHS